jgi:hypothetical protein
VLLHDDTLTELKHYKRDRGLHSMDACVLDLLGRVPSDDVEEAMG